MTDSGIGSPFVDFFKEEGIYEEVSARAIKRVLARQNGGNKPRIVSTINPV